MEPDSIWSEEKRIVGRNDVFRFKPLRIENNNQNEVDKIEVQYVIEHRHTTVDVHDRSELVLDFLNARQQKQRRADRHTQKRQRWRVFIHIKK